MTRLALADTERGSALLMSLIFIFVSTLLGLALFDLSVVESRLVYTSQDDARALEIARGGVERALFKLQQTFNVDKTWSTGSDLCTGGTHRGCSDGTFYPAASTYVSSLNFDSGSYALEFKQVTATTLSIPCKTDNAVVSDVDNTKKICDDLIFVRVTGTLPNNPAGYSPTRTLQLLARATLTPGTCLICGGLTGTAATGTPINGNVRIAGSIQIAGMQGSASLNMGGGAGQTNSYAELDSVSLARIPRLPLICPFGRTCTSPSDLVESLGATLKVYQPTNVPAVTLSGTANLGLDKDNTCGLDCRTYSGDATRQGKGRLDGIFVADGCNMPCTDNFTGATLNSNVFVDDNNITKPYSGPAVAFPLLTGPWQVFGVQYTHLACPLGSSCAAPTTPPTPPTNTEFFVSRAANVMVSANCTDTVGGTGCGPIINSLGSTTGLNDATLAFMTVVRFYNQNNQYMKAMICWRRTTTYTGGLPIPAQTLEFGLPIPDSTSTPPGGPWLSGGGCDTPAPSSAPLLLYFPSSTPATTGFNVQRVGGPTDYNFRGSAMVVTNGLVQIEERWQSCQTAAGSACYNSHGFGGPDLFTRDSSLTVMTWGGNAGVCAGSAACGNMNLADGTSNVDRIMGLFYAGCDPADPACSGNSATKGFLRSRKQTNTVGVAMGYRLCFAGGTSPCPSGGNVPSFFQVIPDTNNLVATIAVPGGGSYTVASVLRYWVECKRTPGDTLPTGLCNYTP
jgi:hypothetical protein